MTNVLIKCPKCSNQEFVDVSEEKLREVKRGLLAVNVPKGTLCEHSFIVYIDKNMKIRDYFTTDFQIEIPELEVPIKVKEVKVPDKHLLNVDLIKLNIPAILITHVFKAIFLKKKIVIVIEEDFLNSQIMNFFNYIYEGTFEFELTLLLEEDYKQRRGEFNDYVIFKGKEILNNPNKALNPKKLSVEKQMVQNFFSNSDLNTSLLHLSESIKNAYFLSKSISDIITNQKEEKINILKINKRLEEQHKIKINNIYLEFLTDIVRNYFNIKLPNIFESFHDLL